MGTDKNIKLHIVTDIKNFIHLKENNKHEQTKRSDNCSSYRWQSQHK